MKLFVVAFTAAVLANNCEAQALNNVIDTCISKIQKEHDEVVVWYDDSSSARNTLALEAISDNLARAKELKMVSRSEIVSKLKNNYEFAKKWEGQYEDWANGWGGQFRNEYAMLCHRAAKKAFFNAYLEAKKLAASCEKSSLTWVLVFSNQGGSSGSKTVTTVVGEKAEKTVSSQLSRSITASVSGPIAALTAGLEASVASEIANSFTASSHRSRTDTLKVNLDKPAYVYQMVANVETGTGVVYAIGGNMQIFNKPIVLN